MTSPNPHAIDTDTLSGMKPLRKVVYSIGSNLGDRLGNLQGAVDAISDTPDIIVVDVSSVYETEPVGGPEDNPQFLNMVMVPRRPCSRERCWNGPSRSRMLSAEPATVSAGVHGLSMWI